MTYRTLVAGLFALGLMACGSPDAGTEIPVITTDAGGQTDDGAANNGATPNNGEAPRNNGAMPNNGVATNNGPDPGTNNGQGTNNSPTTGTAPEVDPACIDGQFAETLPDPSADVSAEIAAYSPNELREFYDAILLKRYPVGATLVRGGLAVFDCVGAFARGTSTAEGAIASLDTVVHECGHAHDLSQGFQTYVINDELTLSCSGAGSTFARSLIGDDEFQTRRPPCGAGFVGCDHYYDTYLTGNGSDQGFDMVLEETVQYVNSLATAYAFQDFVRGSISALDGLLTFLWYTERYLRMARLQYPDDYARITDPCWREAILTVWGRAWWILEEARENGSLGVDEEALFELVRDPELLGEIQRLRDLEGC